MKSNENITIYYTFDRLGHQKSADFPFNNRWKSRLNSKHVLQCFKSQKYQKVTQNCVQRGTQHVSKTWTARERKARDAQWGAATMNSWVLLSKSFLGVPKSTQIFLSVPKGPWAYLSMFKHSQMVGNLTFMQNIDDNSYTFLALARHPFIFSTLSKYSPLLSSTPTYSYVPLTIHKNI